MSLKDKQSLFDRNQKGKLGPTVGTSIPGEGNFFTDKGLNVSPFDATPDGIGSPGGQMVDLLTKAVKSNNHPYLPQGSLTYNPSTKDLDGAKGPQSQLGREEASQKHIDSLTNSTTYQHGNSVENVQPGIYDLDGLVGQMGDYFDNGVLSNRKGQYKNNGPTEGRY